MTDALAVPDGIAISHTRKTAFRRCRRLHHLMYDLGIRPAVDAIQLVVGKAMHSWLEQWFLLARVTSAPQWVPPPVFGETSLEAWRPLESRDPFEAARLRAMMLAYHLRWRGQSMVVLGAEERFSAPFTGPDADVSSTYKRDGIIDAIVEDGDGVWAVEHKSHTGPLDPDNDYWTKLRSDAQCSDYHVGSRALGHDIAGILYDVVCKPDIRPLSATPEDKREMTIGWGCKKCGGDKDKRGDMMNAAGDGMCMTCNGSGWRPATDKSPSGEPRYKSHVRLTDETPGEYGFRCFAIMVAEPERYLHRRAVIRLPDELVEHELDDWETVAAIEADSQRTHHPRNPDACFVPGSCQMRPICWGGVDPTASPLYQIRSRNQTPATEGS